MNKARMRVMPSKFRLRRIFHPIITILAKGLNRIGISPNIATCIMLLFSFLSFFSIFCFSNLFFFSLFIFLVGIFDGIDGAIARLANKVTLFGGLFDSFMDRISEFIIFLGLLIYCWDFLLWNFIDMKIIIFISFFSSIMISYSRARAEVFFKGDFDIGLMARSERLFYLFVTMLIAHFYGFVNEFLFIFMILVISTTYFRYLKIKKIIIDFES